MNLISAIGASSSSVTQWFAVRIHSSPTHTPAHKGPRASPRGTIRATVTAFASVTGLTAGRGAGAQHRGTRQSKRTSCFTFDSVRLL